MLFIDEAYYLYRRENERDYGQETIEILLQIMENQREDVVVILAGYKDKMDIFFQSNPGMGSRIAHHIDFPDYTLDELIQIGQLMLREQQYEFSEEAEKVFRDYLERRMKQPRFANARSVRNALERARLRQANRVVQSKKMLSKSDLMRIEADDILKSRVFSDEEEGQVDALDDNDEGGEEARADEGNEGSEGNDNENDDGRSNGQVEAKGDEENFEEIDENDG